jgi:4'-phosphopantetheinyl transferase
MVIGEARALITWEAPAERADRDVWARAALRRATGRPDIVVERRPSGRPRLAPPYPELGISMARRGRHLIVGFNPCGRVGVDLEPGDQGIPGSDYARLASDHFSPREAAAVHAAENPAIAKELFLRLWVAKEAALKLTGRGVFDGVREPELSDALDRLCIDGKVLEVPASASLPCHRLAVWRCPMGDAATSLSTHVYCAMAVSAD